MNTTEVRRLIEAGVNANVTGSQQTPMHYATYYGNKFKVYEQFREVCSWFSWIFPGSEEMVKLLIEKGYANQVNSVDMNGFTPVHNTATQGNSCYYNIWMDLIQLISKCRLWNHYGITHSKWRRYQ